ncbi:AFG1/ZapE family ATPase [Streptomyces litmocidini]|uniref:AFG1/ZapE family ATPase n=1 Tax=Streptomyces litmocidini TaxID=67318 RepID=UPI0033DA0C04
MSRRPRRRRTVAASRRACACPRGDTGLDALGLTVPEPAEATAVQAHLRELPARAVCRDLVWFAFDALCEAATGVPDHLALAERFPALVLDGVPPPAEVSADGRQRFANPVDVARDRDIRLVLIGAAPWPPSPPTRPSPATWTARRAASPCSGGRTETVGCGRPGRRAALRRSPFRRSPPLVRGRGRGPRPCPAGRRGAERTRPGV